MKFILTSGSFTADKEFKMPKDFTNAFDGPGKNDDFVEIPLVANERERED